MIRALYAGASTVIVTAGLYAAFVIAVIALRLIVENPTPVAFIAGILTPLFILSMIYSLMEASLCWLWRKATAT